MAVVFTSIGVTDLIDIIGGARATATGWYIGMGTGGTSTATEGDVDLNAPLAAASATKVNGLGRASATGESQPNTHQLQWKAKLSNGDSSSRQIDEVGLYIADSGGSSTSTATTLWVRSDFATVTLATDDSIEFTITLSATGG